MNYILGLFSKEDIFSAVRKGREDLVRQFLDRGVKVNSRNYGRSVLTIAIENNKENIVRLLLDRGADINLVNNDGETALMVALIGAFNKDRANIVRLLLERGADVNVINKGRTALIDAARYGYEDIVRQLLDRGANVNQGPYTALMCASSGGHENIVRLLLDRGADVHAVNDMGETALMGAVVTNYKNIVRLLLDRGADINMKDDGGNTALIVASREGHAKMISLLLEKGADFNIANINHETALDVARSQGYDNLVRLLQLAELCDDLSEAGIEELRDILRNDVTAENYPTIAKVFELTATEPTDDNILTFKNSLEQYTKPQLCARLAQYYKGVKQISEEFLSQIYDIQTFQYETLQKKDKEIIKYYIENGYDDERIYPKLDSIIKKLPALQVPLKLYRHSDYEEYQSLSKNMIHITTRPISASYDPIMSDEYTLSEVEDDISCCRLILNISSGYHILFPRPTTEENNENEAIMSSGIKFRVDKISTNNGFYMYDSVDIIRVDKIIKIIEMTTIK